MSSEGDSRRHHESLLNRLFGARPRGRHTQRHDPLLRECPSCAESVYVLADRCRYCGAGLVIPSRVA